MEKIQFDENEDLVDIRHDNVFKAVFARNTPESQGALSRLVSALIGRELTVIKITSNEPPIDNVRDRQMRFDINCRAESGELINVEMSLNPDPFEPVRLEFYAGKLFTGQDIRGVGKDYDDLNLSYQIAILAKERFFPDEGFLHTFEYYDPVHGMPLNGRSRIITLELSKAEKVVDKPTVEMNVQEYWAIYFRYLNDKGKRQKINEILEHEEGIAMASKELLSVSRDEVERARLMSEYKYELDTQSRLVHAKKEGMKEGRQVGIKQGIKEGKQEVIALLKSGKSLEEIIREYGDG